MRNRLIAAALIGAALSMPGLGQQTSIATRSSWPTGSLRTGPRPRPLEGAQRLLDAAQAKRDRKAAKRLRDAARSAERRHPFERAAAALASEY